MTTSEKPAAITNDMIIDAAAEATNAATELLGERFPGADVMVLAQAWNDVHHKIKAVIFDIIPHTDEEG